MAGPLKTVLVGGHAGAQQLARLRTEAQAIARLQHPNLVQLYEAGESGGHPFLALDLRQAKHVGRGPMSMPWGPSSTSC